MENKTYDLVCGNRKILKELFEKIELLCELLDLGVLQNKLSECVVRNISEWSSEIECLTGHNYGYSDISAKECVLSIENKEQ